MIRMFLGIILFLVGAGLMIWSLHDEMKEDNIASSKLTQAILNLGVRR